MIGPVHKLPEHSRRKDVNNVIQEPDFQNFVKGVQIQNTARKALFNVNERVWTHLIDELPDNEKHQLSTFLHCFGRNDSNTSTTSENLELGHPNCDLLYSRLKELNDKAIIADEQAEESSTSKNLECGHPNCDLLYSRLKELNDKAIIADEQAEESSYFDSPFTWDFIKCFMKVMEMKEDITLLKSKLGTSLLIKLMKSCRLFAFDGDKIYDKILDDMDMLLYLQDMHMSSEQLKKLSENLMELLKHWAQKFRTCKDAVKDIEKIVQTTTDCESDEYKFLAKNSLEIVDGLLSMKDCKSEARHINQVTALRELLSTLLEELDNSNVTLEENEEGPEQQNEVLKEDMQIIRTKVTTIEELHCEFTKLKEENDSLKQEMQAIQKENERLKISITEKDNELLNSEKEKRTLKEDSQKMKGEESPASISDAKEAPLVSARGRGRGGRRGGRVFRGQQFQENEVKWLVKLHAERQETADEMIDSLTWEEAKAMLKEVSNRQPALNLDIADILSRRQCSPGPADPEQPGPAYQQPSWCVCTKCPAMNRDEDKVCCEMAPKFCNSLRPEMGLVITDPLLLLLQQTFRSDVFVQQATTIEDTNKDMRRAAYRRYVSWVNGKLEKGDRRAVPACCVKIIRDKFPSSSGHYTGFIPAYHGIGWW